MRDRKRIVIVLIFAISILIALLLWQTLSPFWNGSEIVTPENLVASPESIFWGTLNLGQTVTRKVTLANIGNEPIGPLNMTASQTVGELVWDAEDLVIPAGQSLIANFTLTLSQTGEIGPFTIDIIVGY